MTLRAKMAMPHFQRYPLSLNQTKNVKTRVFSVSVYFGEILHRFFLKQYYMFSKKVGKFTSCKK